MRRKKIPGKKTKGYKDPEVQKERREKALKGKTDVKPLNPDEQEIPKKLQMIMKAKEDPSVFSRRRFRKPKPETFEGKKLLDSSRFVTVENRLPGMKKDLRPIPVFKQVAGESQKKFFNRMEKTVKSYLKRKDYERKYDVEVHDDLKTGETVVKNREKDEIDLEMEKQKQKRLSKKGIVVKTKEEKRQMRRAKEKERKFKKKRCKDGQDEDFEDFKDHVEFDEVSHAPPTKLAGFKSLAERRPGLKANTLLLNKKLKQEPVSMARKKVLEDERQRVVEAYRKIRAERYNKSN